MYLLITLSKARFDGKFLFQILIEYINFHLTAHSKELINNILSIHAISGCDTVSSLYGIGKTKSSKNIVKSPQLATYLVVFLDPDATPENICTKGKIILSASM